MKITSYVRTNARKVFKQNYLMCAALCFFGLFGPLGMSYRSRELNKAMWKGALLGLPQLPLVFYVWKLVCIDLLSLSAEPGVISLILVMSAYVAYLIAFAFLYKTE